MNERIDQLLDEMLYESGREAFYDDAPRPTEADGWDPSFIHGYEEAREDCRLDQELHADSLNWPASDLP